MKKLWSAINEKSFGQQLGEPSVFQNEANGIMTTDAALKNRLNCFPSPDIPSLERRSNALRRGDFFSLKVFLTVTVGSFRREVETRDTSRYEYIIFFNEQGPAYSLNYLTPKQYRETHTA